ncbi:MAG: hypothetical protein QNJ36_11090 [Calothrix sp. MO_167.B42]|nr:hypothetical protein [Calothrix sp. MO_167.B42]
MFHAPGAKAHRGREEEGAVWGKGIQLASTSLSRVRKLYQSPANNNGNIYVSRKDAKAQRRREEEDAVWGKGTQLASTSLQVGFGSCIKVPQTARLYIIRTLNFGQIMYP